MRRPSTRVARYVLAACPRTHLSSALHSSQIRADYKLVAKALGRIGTAYQRKGDLASAVKFYEKSLSEHRTPDILNKLRDVRFPFMRSWVAHADSATGGKGEGGDG